MSIETNVTNNNTNDTNDSPNFLHSMRNTSLPVYVKDEHGNPTSTIEKKTLDKPYVDKDNQFITEVDNYDSGEFSDNVELRFNTSDKASVDSDEWAIISRDKMITLCKMHGKMKLSDSDSDYERTSLVECENTHNGVKHKGFKLIYKPVDRSKGADYSAVKSFADMFSTDVTDTVASTL